MAGSPAGRILRVNLTTGLCQQETLASETMQIWLGGRGLGTALLRDVTGCDVFDPDQLLVFSVGSLCSTLTPLSARCVLTTRSPLTNTIFSCSSGGPFAWQLKRTGFTALVLQGASATPCLLEITPDGAALAPASELWGLGVNATLKCLDRSSGAAAVIGPAGENGVRYASIETRDGEPFSRGGLGAVMGRKGLKGITVRGDAETLIADQPAFDKALEDLMRLFRASPFLYGPLGIRKQGTAALVDLLAQRGMLPGNNFVGFSGNATDWNAAALRNRYSPQAGGCHDCPVACKRLLPDGSYLPGYDQLATFGGLCGLSELDQITNISRQCCDLGLDPLSTGATLAVWAQITGQELSRLALDPLLADISTRAGQGDLLSLGAAQLAQQLGQPEKAMTVKGLELPPYDPRASTGLALGYATSPHGGSHLTAWPIASEILRKPVPTDRFSFDGKARIINLFEDANAAVDSLVLCRFASAAAELEELAALLAAVTGEGYGPADLMQIGRRIVTAEQAFNRCNGFTDADDTLPEHFFAESANGLAPLDQRRFEQELAAYHRIRASQTDDRSY
jgi:aldehyde:ferredoxin oxidoreductase